MNYAKNLIELHETLRALDAGSELYYRCSPYGNCNGAYTLHDLLNKSLVLKPHRDGKRLYKEYKLECRICDYERIFAFEE